MSAEDRQQYLTLLRNNFIKEQRESLVFYVYYHDENYYGILSACTQLNANFLAKSNSILIEASEFEHLMMEVEEGDGTRVEESNSVWEIPDIVQPSWLDQPMSTSIVEQAVPQQDVAEELPAPRYEVAAETQEEYVPKNAPVLEKIADLEMRPMEASAAVDPYALSAEEIAAIHAATHPVEERVFDVAPVSEEPVIAAATEPMEVREEVFVAPFVEQPQYQEPATVLVPVDMEAKPIHYAETLQETQRKALEVRQNSIELREQALRQREKAVNDWERSLNAREAESDALQDTFNMRKQAMAQKEQRLVSMEEEVLLKRNILEDSFAKLDEVKREARRVLG